MKIAKLKMGERKKEMICRHLSSCSISIDISKLYMQQTKFVNHRYNLLFLKHKLDKFSWRSEDNRMFTWEGKIPSGFSGVSQQVRWTFSWQSRLGNLGSLGMAGMKEIIVKLNKTF